MFDVLPPDIYNRTKEMVADQVSYSISVLSQNSPLESRSFEVGNDQSPLQVVVVPNRQVPQNLTRLLYAQVDQYAPQYHLAAPATIAGVLQSLKDLGIADAEFFTTPSNKLIISTMGYVIRIDNDPQSFLR